MVRSDHLQGTVLVLAWCPAWQSSATLTNHDKLTLISSALCAAPSLVSTEMCQIPKHSMNKRARYARGVAMSLPHPRSGNTSSSVTELGDKLSSSSSSPIRGLRSSWASAALDFLPGAQQHPQHMMHIPIKSMPIVKRSNPAIRRGSNTTEVAH